MATNDASSTQNTVTKFTEGLRSMHVKVVYTLNDNIQQFFLARHTPIAVRIIQRPKPSRRQRQKAAKQFKAQQLALTPSSIKLSTPVRRSQTKAQVEHDMNLGDDTGDEEVEEREEKVEYGYAPLKVCINAIWAASPDLAYDRSRDWSIYCLDPLEQSSSGRHLSDDSVASKFSGVMTGMGLVSHALQEDDRTFNPVSVTGKIIQDQGRQALEVILQMKTTMSAGAMAPPFAPWAHHPMMFGFPGMPGFFRPPPGAIVPIPAGNPRPQAAPRAKSQKPSSAPTPASTDASTPATSETTPLPDASTDSTYSRSASIGPKVDPPRKKRLVKTTVETTRKEKTKEVVKEFSQPPPGTMEALASLATRLNSDGGDEPPPPDTAEGQLLDCMVTWLKNAAAASEGANSTDRKDKKVDPFSASALFTRAALPLPKSSNQGSSRASSSQPPSQGPGSRTGPGGRPKETTVSGKGSNKGLNRSLSGPVVGRKRNLDDEEYDPARKRQKTARTVSNASTSTIHTLSSTSLVSKPLKSTESIGKGLLNFPSTSEILGLKFAPGRAYTTNLDDKPPSDESMVVKKTAPAPETPRQRRRMSGSSPSFHGLPLTSPFVSGAGGGDDSLFSEAGTPATIRHLSPFKALGRGALDDGVRPSSPCERRANTTATGKRKVPKTPVRMLGRRAASSSSPSPKRRARPDWTTNLPPSSPPAPSSPITDAASLTPADADDEGDGGTQGDLGTQDDFSQSITNADLVVDVNESPSKFFARYFDLSAVTLDTSDLTQSLLGNLGRGTTPSDGTSDGEYLPEFDLDAQGFSSSSFSLDELGWSDAGFTSGPAESEGEFDDGTTTGAASDIDFDVGELLTWARQNTRTIESSEAAAEVEELLEPEEDSSTPQRNKVAGSDQDPMRALLDRCAV